MKNFHFFHETEFFGSFHPQNHLQNTHFNTRNGNFWVVSPFFKVFRKGEARRNADGRLVVSASCLEDKNEKLQKSAEDFTKMNSSGHFCTKTCKKRSKIVRKSIFRCNFERVYII